jgi:hypothetical protein
VLVYLSLLYIHHHHLWSVCLSHFHLFDFFLRTNWNQTWRKSFFDGSRHCTRFL